jgi:hypothetical protein
MSAETAAETAVWTPWDSPLLLPATHRLKQPATTAAQRREANCEALRDITKARRKEHKQEILNTKRAQVSASTVRVPNALGLIFEDPALAMSCLCADCRHKTPVYVSHRGGLKHNFVCGACTGIIAAGTLCPYCNVRPVFICPHGEPPVYSACNICTQAGRRDEVPARPPCTWCNLEVADGLLARFKHRAPLLASSDPVVCAEARAALNEVMKETTEKKAMVAFAEYSVLRQELITAVTAANERFGLPSLLPWQ